jgi:ATP-dependent helicase/DNAse subunit B
MTVQLLLAPARGGKTAHAISRIRGLHGSAPLAPVWVVLPNFPQVTGFRRRLAQAGGALGVEAGTFYRLYADVLSRAGMLAPRLFDPVQHRLLRAIVDRFCAEGHLCHYAPLRDKPGFVRALRTLVQELKRARVHRDAFAAGVADQPPRLAELAAIYAAYQDWLVTSGWTDAEGQGWLAAQALERDPALYADLALLVVDGFDEFNPTQLEVLRLLAGRATETIITLTGDPAPLPPYRGDGGARPAHRRFARALSMLTTALDSFLHPPFSILPPPFSMSPPLPLSPAPPPPLSPSPPPLVHLEANLFEPNAAQCPADGAVAFVEAQDRRQEVRAALRWLKARIVQDGMAPHEVALLARDLDPYLPFLEETAAEFGLPLHLAAGADLLSNPAVAALLSLLSLPALDWPRRPLVEALASPYFDWSAILEESGVGLGARLDAVARAGLVIQGLDQWYQALDRRVEVQAEAGAAGEEEGVASSDLPIGEEALALRHAFARFVGRLTPEPQAALRDTVAWVEGIIGDDPDLAHPSAAAQDDGSLRVVARVREAENEPGGRPLARRDVAALQALKDVLRGLVLSESLLSSPLPPSPPLPCSPAPPPPPLPAGDRPGGGSPLFSPLPAGEGLGEGVPYPRFFAELHSAVEAATYALPSPEESGLLVAPLLHARGLSFRAVALVGLSEGEFPAAEREDPLLREEDRALLRARGLPLEPRLRGEEVTLFYEAVTRARERLLLCRPYLADDGQAWEPSPYWRHLQRLVSASARRVRPVELLLDEAASPQEFLTVAAQSEASSAPLEGDGAGDPEWQAVLAGAEVVRARLARSPAGPHEGDLSPLAPALTARYGPDHVWSSSRLETYAKCPLHFYVAHALRLEPRAVPQEGFDPLILGSIYHRVLERVYQLAPAEPLSALPEIAREVFTDAPREYGFRPTPLWEQQQREFLQVLERTVVALEETRAEYVPHAQELPFGLHGAPSLTLHSPSSILPPLSSTIQIRGYIDRVDRAPDGSLRVIDYKAGSSRISARELEEGTRLQLPLYALAVRDALRLGPVTDGFYWHIGSASPSYLRLGRYEGGVEGAIEQAVEHVLAYVAAVRAGQFAPMPPAGGCPGHCPAVGFCWRYAPRQW